MEFLEKIQNNPIGGLLGIIAIISAIVVGGKIGERMRPITGYLISILLVAALVAVAREIKEPSGTIAFCLFGTLGIFLGVGSKANKYKTGEWPKPKPKPQGPTPVVQAPPPPPPAAPVPQTIIHYTDNRDQSIRIDNSVHITAGAMTPDAARSLLGLPIHFTGQRLENAYEEKIRILDMQAQALPRNNQQARLLISKQEDQLEQAYELLKKN